MRFAKGKGVLASEEGAAKAGIKKVRNNSHLVLTRRIRSDIFITSKS